jgi:acetyltransferase-like isoleucine patch superfamily enzyme
MVEFLAHVLTFFIFPRKLRVRLRNRLIYLAHGLPVRLKAKRVGKALHCGGAVHATRFTELGDHVHFNGMWASGNGRLVIGDWFHSGDGLRIFTRNHNYDKGEAIPYDKTYITKDVIIGDFVWIGSQVILLPGTTIGEGAIIQAGSVVHGHIPAYAIAGGNPAKVFAQRDIEHFKRLKAEGKFH